MPYQPFRKRRIDATTSGGGAIVPYPATLRFRSARLAALALIALVLSACVAAKDTHDRRLLVLDLLVESLAVEVRSAALALGDEMGLAVVSRRPASEDAWVRVEAEAPRQSTVDSLAVPVRYWAILGAFWSVAESVRLEDLRRSVSGGGPFEVFAPEHIVMSARAVLGGASVRPVHPADLPAALSSREAAVAILPADLATPRLRSLGLDGRDALRGDPWPDALVEKLWLTWSGVEAEAFARELARRLSVPPPTTVRIAATGDIIPARCVYALHRARDDYTLAFQTTAPYLKAADIAVGSLDASISDAGQPYGCEETFRLTAPARAVEGLVHAGFDVISVATNHIKDCGREPCGDRAFLDTLDNLRRAGIQPVGGGRNEAEARTPVVLTVKGVRFAFLAYDDIGDGYYGAGPTTPGTASLSEQALREDIDKARRVADVVVVLPHWGTEYEYRQSARQRELAQVAIDAGATLVVGNHPHVAQGVEWRGDGFIAYALGNFVFDQDWSPETQQGLVVEATFVGARLVAVRLLPVRIVDMHRATWAPESEGRATLERVRRFSLGP